MQVLYTHSWIHPASSSCAPTVLHTTSSTLSVSLSRSPLSFGTRLWELRSILCGNALMPPAPVRYAWQWLASISIPLSLGCCISVTSVYIFRGSWLDFLLYQVLCCCIPYLIWHCSLIPDAFYISVAACGWGFTAIICWSPEETTVILVTAGLVYLISAIYSLFYGCVVSCRLIYVLVLLAPPRPWPYS